MESFINEYSFYICNEDMSISYRGLRLLPSNSAMRELMHLGLTLFDCKKILEQGILAPRRRKKIINIVIVESYNEINKEKVWVITHVGRFTKK